MELITALILIVFALGSTFLARSLMKLMNHIANSTSEVLLKISKDSTESLEKITHVTTQNTYTLKELAENITSSNRGMHEELKLIKGKIRDINQYRAAEKKLKKIEDQKEN
jgi:hypothetical protein